MKGNGQHHGVVVRQVGRGKGVQAVGEDGDSQHDADELVEEGQSVIFEHFTGSATVLLGADQLGAAFADTEIEGDKSGEDIQPGGETADLDESNTSGHAQHIETGQAGVRRE